ncbi:MULTISPECIES: HAD family acid phosphatase [Streptomyces]|jgi:predicted secreted acid phosphatase|uniref:Putative secreted acid phosphatase n=1 Tax=Streptomyces nymphaeiformis TaxID=2663842 RepID=A0A7W7U362_9ACTN|nr:HAD family acid phosphatase [Streptomyces nymphaeiformis]MBB4983292.1 putative secreted acid phosphatase [Streptomyces nymphaeiformis]
MPSVPSAKATATAATALGLTALLVVGAAPAASAADPDTHLTSAAALAHVDYTTWRHDVAAVVAEARPYIEARAENAGREKQAIVLDIDNSSLETDFHPFWELPTPAIADVRSLVNDAHARGVAVFFVTARPGIIYSLTDWNLKKAGYPVDGLYVRSLPDLFGEVSAYKTEKRAEIEAKGYTIIANIGNNTTDLVGGHAERAFKLPDYGGKLS